MGLTGDIERGEPSRPGTDFHFDPLSAGLGFLMLQTVPIIVMALLVQFGLPYSELSAADQLAWGMGGFLFASLFVLAYGWFTGRRIRWGKARPLGVVWRWILGFTLFFAVLLGYLELRRALDHPVAPQQVLTVIGSGASGLQWWYLAAMAVVAAPLVEEVVFRGMIQDALRRTFDPVSAIVLTGIVFGLVHGAHYAPPLAIAGMFFGWLREWSGGLWAPILAHALHNATVLVLALAAPELMAWMYRMA